jgi:hypothetical protein
MTLEGLLGLDLLGRLVSKEKTAAMDSLSQKSWSWCIKLICLCEMTIY